MADPAELHAAALCLDAAAPMVSPRALPRIADDLAAGGVDAVLATVASIESTRDTLDVLGRWLEVDRDRHAPAAVVTSAAELRAARDRGDLAVVLHLQGGNPLEANADLVGVFHRLGIRVLQLTYNHRNLIGDGCLEDSDSGLSSFGRSVVRGCAEHRLVIDISHAGHRTSREAIEVSAGPVVATHANARAVCDSPRNLSDELIRAIADSGGVVGLCAFPAFVSGSGEATLGQLLDHADHICELVGPEHVGLGLDFAQEDEGDYEYYRYDPRYYPPPPWTYPAGIGGFRELPNVTEALRARGFPESAVTGILGENFLRVFESVWGS